MAYNWLTSLIALLVGSVITINGVVVNSDDLIASATSAVNGANFHQIATVLEVYYMEHGEYPKATSGEELMDIFEKESMIRNRPIDADVFEYRTTQNGNDYILKIKKQK
ncbi:MAG: hypothetical protein Q8P52_00525 [bacterium]|nr:hypothetical protein [bacterium]